jgi:hypothetical protein
MAPGTPGTPRFGEYADKHKKKTDASGDSSVALQADGDFEEIHFIYKPSQRSREVGSPPGKYFDTAERQYDAPSNHDGWFGGDAHLVNLDERKVLENSIYSTKIECSDDVQDIDGTDERS